MSTEIPAFFWDVDSPATLARMRADVFDPFREAVPKFDAILSYGGGPACRDRYGDFGARAYYNIYNGLDPETHYRVIPDLELKYDLAFLGNRLPDREARVEELFLRAADLAPEASFLLGGEGWGDKRLPNNVRWIGHVPTGDHNRLNSSAGMLLNINRMSMADAGYSPPTRIFEAAGAGACMLCDHWPGIEDCFTPGTEILLVRRAEDVVAALKEYGTEARKRIGAAFQKRALRDHTYAIRAAQVEAAITDSLAKRDKPIGTTAERMAQPA